MKGELFINEKDAYTEWGISMDTTSLSSLMTPPPMKDFIENKSRLRPGKSVITSNVYVDERDVTISFHLTAKDEFSFFKQYESFCNELEKGTLDIRTKYQPNTVYRMIYISCNQFSQYFRGIAKFSLKLNEPNPKNRTIKSD